MHYKRASHLEVSLDERRIEAPIGGLDAICSELLSIWICWFGCKPSSSARYSFDAAAQESNSMDGLRDTQDLLY